MPGPPGAQAGLDGRAAVCGSSRAARLWCCDWRANLACEERCRRAGITGLRSTRSRGVGPGQR